MHLYRPLELSALKESRKMSYKSQARKEEMNREIDLLLGQIDVEVEQQIKYSFDELRNLLSKMNSEVVLADRRCGEASVVMDNLSRICKEL